MFLYEKNINNINDNRTRSSVFTYYWNCYKRNWNWKLLHKNDIKTTFKWQ